MKRLFPLAALITAAVWAHAADSAPASSNVGTAEYPRIASALRHGDKPVEFPSDMVESATATLHVTKLHFPKPLPGARSGAVEILGTEGYLVSIRPRYSYAKATSPPRVFELEDSPLEARHGVTQVTAVDYKFPVDEYPSRIFTAEGYRMSGAVPSYPSVEPVGANVPFAIFAHDFFNPELPSGISEHFSGTPAPGGLRWPRETGQNNGYTYSYACELSKLVRDRIAVCDGVLNDCFNDADSFYRLPFIVGFPIWGMGQGNCGQATHSGNSRYAYDLGAPAGVEIRAARGGVVVSVKESESQNCCPLGTGIDDCFDPCPFGANSVTIEHQDGTVAVYAHMPLNGVIVAKGDRVRRGDPIAVVGNTGLSTGPHLHFVVKKALGDQSQPSRFQALFSDSSIRNCFRPAPSDTLFSNNKAWYE